jgi:hypothetical protein
MPKEDGAEPAAAVTTGATNEEASAQLPQSVAEPGSEDAAPVSGKVFNDYIINARHSECYGGRDSLRVGRNVINTKRIVFNMSAVHYGLRSTLF